MWMKSRTVREELAVGKDEGVACDSMGELGHTLQGVQDGSDGRKRCIYWSVAAWGVEGHTVGGSKEVVVEGRSL